MFKNMSLRIWVIGGVLATIIASVAIATWLSLSDQQKRLMQDAHGAHTRVTQVLALGIQKALWDLSPESAAPLARSIMEDKRIVKVSVLDSKNDVFLEEAREDRRLGQVVTQEGTIAVDDQVLGKVIVEFSMAEAQAELRSRIIDLVGLALAEVIGCGIVLAFLLHYRVLSRIDRLKVEAHEIAEKRLNRPFVWKEQDEIGKLGQSLESTRLSLAELFSELEVKNQKLSTINGKLENLVEERTATIKVILDHVKTGFLLIDHEFKVLEGYTRSCEVLLDRTQIRSIPLSKALGLYAESEQHFNLAVEQVFQDLLPESVSLGQVPGNFTIGDHTISLEGSTIRNAEGQVSKILFTIIDVSLLKSIEMENQINRSIVNIMQNMNSFRDFIQDSKDRLKSCYSAIETGNIVSLRHDLHTLKGNSAAFGIKQLAELIHSTEDQQNIVPEYLTDIEESLKSFLDTHYSLLRVKFDGEQKRVIAIDEERLDLIESEISHLQNGDELKASIKNWLLELRKDTVESMLGPMANYIHKLAQQRGVELDFQVEGGDIRMERGEASEIFHSLIHILRNAVDHGLEPAHERGKKPTQAQLILTFKITDHSYVISVSDDGRGIDPNMVLKKALDMGLVKMQDIAAMSEEQILQLIFLDGLSTAESVTDVSGRGIGMQAVADGVQKLGGSLELRSVIGKGTSLVLSLPISTRVNKVNRAA